MSSRPVKVYTLYDNTDVTNYTELPINWLETKPSLFPPMENIPKSYWQLGMPENDKILMENKIRSNSDYRKYMIANSEKIRSDNFMKYGEQFGK